MDDDLNAFCDYKKVDMVKDGSGPLSDLKFAVKDIYDIAGERTGAGSVDWLNTHAPATRTAPVVERLLDAGAHLMGVTHSTELTRGIVGDNVHYGTPRNPRAPGRVPGGSSSGSASAVAGGVVDFALGSDTNGSISVPASFCGIFGIKSTHGRLSLEGVFKQAPAFDTVGWFAKNPWILERVGHVLFGSGQAIGAPAQVLIAEDAFAMADASAQAALHDAVLVFEKLGLKVSSARFCPVGLEELYDARYVLHGREAWQTFRPWLEKANPRVSFQILEKCIRGGLFSDEEEAQARRFLKPVRSRMERLFAGRTVVCLPATAGVAWQADVPMAAIADSVRRTGILVSIGSTLNVPQLTVPIVGCGELPLGLSLLGERGSDEALLALARQMMPE